jgi:hypothetical protein
MNFGFDWVCFGFELALFVHSSYFAFFFIFFCKYTLCINFTLSAIGFVWV